MLLGYLLLPTLMNVFCAATLAESMPVLPASGWILVTTGYNIAVNWFGIRTSARFNVCTLMFQVALLIGFLILGIHALLSAAMPLFSSSPSWGPTTTPAGVFSAASLCVMACLGVDAITTLSGEVRADQRHLIGRAVVGSLLALGALSIVNVWVLSDLSRGLTFEDPTTATFEIIGTLISPALGAFTAWAMALIVAISIAPPMVTGVWRVLRAMAQNGAVPAPLASLHPGYLVPHIALLVSGVASIEIALHFAGWFDTLTSMVNFGRCPRSLRSTHR